MTNAQFIFNALTKQDMANVVAFMKENKATSLNDAINWLFEVFYVGGEYVICERDHDLPCAEYMNHCLIDACELYNSSSVNEEEDEIIPF